MHALLEHVLGPCDDPDCEIHCIEMGIAEETVTDIELAFFIAGAQRMAAVLDDVRERLLDIQALARGR